MLNMFKKDKSEYNYYRSFDEIAGLIVEVAEMLNHILKNYELSTLEEKLKEMHKIERDADDKKKQMMAYLYKDFLPPIEREDIIEMAYELDTVLDNIEDIVIQMNMYQIQDLEAAMLDFGELIEAAAHKLADITKVLSNFKNPEKILALTEEIINIESRADLIYYRAIKNLHIGKVDPYKSYRYSRIYDVFELSADSFEEITNVVEAIILKNS